MVINLGMALQLPNNMNMQVPELDRVALLSDASRGKVMHDIGLAIDTIYNDARCNFV